MLKKLSNFFSSEAFEQRARDRERRKLVEELEAITRDHWYNAKRQPQIVARLQALTQADSTARLEHGRRAFALACDGLSAAGAGAVGGFIGFASAAAVAVIGDDACLGGEVQS